MKIKAFLTLFILISFNSFAQQKVNFSAKYQKENRGKYKVEIHEIKELVTIMLAITNSGKENDDMFQQEGQYYKDLRAYFQPFENEKIIKTFDSLMVVSPYNYIFLTGNAISYNLKGNKLVKSDVFNFPANAIANVKITENPITTYKKEIEDFAKKSKFKKFYSKNRSFYNQIISDYDKNANLGKQWVWLEKNFQTKKDSYIIFCSPLINGLNYTSQFNDNGFTLIHMSLPPVDNYPNYTALENELLNTRIMFTEIDHNYVNAPSEANKELINQVFADRKIWVNDKTEGTFAYPKPVQVFNEYMTYGVFVLYCQDNYDKTTLEKVKTDIVTQMTNRGFPQMKVFVDNLLKMRAKYPNDTIEKWYPELLNLWKK